MRFRRPRLKLLLDEGVPNAVGKAFTTSGHKVILGNQALPRGSSDQLVCAFAELNSSILVALDGDMKQIAKGMGVGKTRFKALSLLKLSCRETRAADRVQSAMTLIEHEWHVSGTASGRRIYIEISDSVIRLMR